MATAAGTAKKQKVKISKTIFFHLHYVFLYICNMKLPSFSRLLYGVGERNTHTQKKIWSFRIQPQKMSSIFDKLNGIE